MAAKDLRIGQTTQLPIKGKWINVVIKRLHETCVAGAMAGTPHVHIVHNHGETCRAFSAAG